jgi:F0F1-type ATP synthase membrane subunit a
MEHIISHEVGICVGLLLGACIVGILIKPVAHLPYTIALTLVGLVIGLFHFAKISETGFSIVFFSLVFQGITMKPLLSFLKVRES